jgi:4-alpha-glucanotransferase
MSHDATALGRQALLRRSSGILLHPTSLPGPHGIGDLGPAAYRFADFLAETGQSLWQILPLGPVGYGNSPYMCLSAFAGNPLLLSLDRLADAGLLEEGEITPPGGLPAERVDYARVVAFKRELLQLAHSRFESRASSEARQAYFQFCERAASWLEDYALFAALKGAHGGRQWTAWEPGAAQRDHGVLDDWRNRLAAEIEWHKFLQFAFHEQWSALREYCAARDIRLIGDTPIYVAHDSAEVWARRDLFHLDDSGEPTVVAGVPPDYFSATGQRWGNPIYNWQRMADTDYEWWLNRMLSDFSQVDFVRLDHFRGFEAYWEVPASEPVATHGRWVRGPGAEFFERIGERLAARGVEPRIIVEDLGVITPEVDALREQFGFPGMRILQMAFGTDPKGSEYKPHNHPRNSVVYTGSHDHNTTVGWFTAEPGSQSTQTEAEIEAEREATRRYIGSDGDEIHWDFIRLAFGSPAAMAVIPLQDVLGLGTESRMNRPGTSSGNWEWRFTEERLDTATRRRLAMLTETYERQS